MQMILNELSADFPVCSREEGKVVMSNFLRVYRDVRRFIQNDSLVVDKRYDLFQLGRNYHISEWRKDSTVDREEQRLFGSILNKAVVYDGREIDDVTIDINYSEFKYKTLNAIGCLIAYESDNFVLSFETHEFWKKKYIKGLYTTLSDLKTFECPKEVNVLNISKPEDVCYLKENYLEQIKERYYKVKSGKELLNYCTEWFPAILFCENAERQLKEENSYINIQQIIKKLLELNEYFSNATGNFDMKALKNCSPETDITLKHFREDHTFEMPDGKPELFNFHIRFTGTYAGRIFFKPDIENQRCIVAHIGKKLKNQKYH